jgi:hypothetical protein
LRYSFNLGICLLSGSVLSLQASILIAGVAASNIAFIASALFLYRYYPNRFIPCLKVKEILIFTTQVNKNLVWKLGFCFFHSRRILFQPRKHLFQCCLHRKSLFSVRLCGIILALHISGPVIDTGTIFPECYNWHWFLSPCLELLFGYGNKVEWAGPYWVSGALLYFKFR